MGNSHHSANTGSLPNKALLKWSWREIKHGQLWPVAMALTLIIACVFGLAALADRLDQVVMNQGKNALTADTVFRSSNPLPQTLLDDVAKKSVQTATLTRFATMAFSDNSMQLVTVKAVDSAYPLRGEMLLQGKKRAQKKQASQPKSVSQGDNSISNHVNNNQLWLEPRVMDQLQVKIGDNVTIGDADFKVSGQVLQEPGLAFNPFQQMPSVYIHQSDVAKTGAVQVGSRVSFRLFINASQNQIDALKKQIELTPSDRWIDQDSQSRTSEVFERTKQYLSLTVAIVIVMAAITLVLTCQHYVASRRQTIVMLKSLGAQKQWLIRWLSLQIGSLFVIGMVIGVILEVLLRIPLTDVLPDPLPSYGWMPLVFSIGTCLAIGIPALGIPLLGLLNTSAASVMQDSAAKISKKAWSLVLLPFVLLILAYGSNVLVWMVLASIMVLFVLLAIISLGVARLLQRLPATPALKLALSRINRSSLASGIQFGALALSLMLIAMIWLVRNDLLSDWQQTLPPDAPNVFALNIADHEKDAYLQQLDQAKLIRSQAYPIIRGRISQINGVDAKEYAHGEDKSDSLRRELNFTWADSLPQSNDLLEGTWGESGSVSVESGVADDLGLKIGDTVSFVISSQTVSAKVNTIRKVHWREMKPNFYFIFTPDVLKDIAGTWLVSFKAPQSKNMEVETEQLDGNLFLNTLSRDYPTVSLMDIRTMAGKIQVLLTQIVWSITVLAGLGVVAGLLLIFTLLRLSLSQRQQEIRLYRTLGASRKRINRTVWYEYGIMALIAGLVACVGAEASVASIMKWGFELEPTWHWGLWFSLPALAFVTLALVLKTLISQLLVPMNKVND
ncbi:ABC transporter permease [Vibrio sp. S11_S32]|uniref:ABC transporter permease n=1 Tax=Vibrio sp. S11_S32 TaxID=2720225 RepID=UPI001680E9CA|nr:ABC transporter permease [Vibrio sp. S11_S32]MBD1576509.1 ABC transporter permease [Vibrio sp. S11_S32]